ncbi:MAG: HAMP domain-containing sensor histidine kinase [Patescibacteria group bacterium]|nr:HAMP domain-containing sensor histidine kinase [Patescibacteria group bacterium]
MAIKVFNELAQLIEHECDALLAGWRAQVRALPAARDLDVPTLNDHIPLLLVELATELRAGSDETIAHALHDGSPPAHGVQRVKDAFDIEEVVAEYNILRGCIHDLAEQHGLSIRGRPFHVLNRFLDGAIGSAVQSFATQKALEIRQRREDYLAFVAHDLRTPLSAISLSARVLEMLLMRDRTETPQTAQMLKTLNRNVQHLQDMIEKVLQENTNLESEVGVKLERRRFDLWPLVEALIHDLHPVAGTGSTRLINAIPGDFAVYADASLLRRVFQNLIANAISYTPRGEVVIGASLTGEAGTAECFVRDNGEGIPEDRRLAVFDKHETDPEKQGGMGLGLAIVKTFVEAHDGVVTVESELGVGSTFRFTLPGQRS